MAPKSAPWLFRSPSSNPPEGPVSPLDADTNEWNAGSDSEPEANTLSPTQRMVSSFAQQAGLGRRPPPSPSASLAPPSQPKPPKKPDRNPSFGGFFDFSVLRSSSTSVAAKESKEESIPEGYQLMRSPSQQMVDPIGPLDFDPQSSSAGKKKEVDTGKTEVILTEQEMKDAIRNDVLDIVADPVSLLKKMPIFDQDAPQTDSEAEPAKEYTLNSATKESGDKQRIAKRNRKFTDCLQKDTIDIGELRKLSWAGIPPEVRPCVWQFLLGYLPAPSSRRKTVLARKRTEYADASRMAFARGEASLDAAIWHQIQIDLPRTNPGIRLWQFDATKRALERILYVWAIRHPASGYVQGINDLATPFFQVFLSAYVDTEPESYDVSVLPQEVLNAIEADTFWCLSKLLDGIQDNYIYAQPGIQRQVSRMQDLCGRVDAPLAQHLEKENITFIQFSFRWFHLLFLRVLPTNAVIRMWDTYMSEGSDAFADFHTYVCLAFLLRFSEKLRSMDFQEIMLFFQNPVEHEEWEEKNTEVLLSEGYMWKALFAGAPKHLGCK